MPTFLPGPSGAERPTPQGCQSLSPPLCILPGFLALQTEREKPQLQGIPTHPGQPRSPQVPSVPSPPASPLPPGAFNLSPDHMMQPTHPGSPPTLKGVSPSPSCTFYPHPQGCCAGVPAARYLHTGAPLRRGWGLLLTGSFTTQVRGTALSPGLKETLRSNPPQDTQSTPWTQHNTQGIQL